MGCKSCKQSMNQPLPDPHFAATLGKACDEVFGCMDAEVVDARDMEIDQFESAPDYFFTIRVKKDKDGHPYYQPMLTPGATVIPYQNMANRRSLPSNNAGLKVEPGQVVPAYMENNGSGFIIRAADANHPAQFIVLSVDEEGAAICQNAGWVDMPVGHQYIVGANYYRSKNEGEVTTDPDETGQYLFTPVGRFTLALEIKRGV